MRKNRSGGFQKYLNTLCRELHHEKYGKFTLANKAKQQYLEEFGFDETALDNPLGYPWIYLKSEFQCSSLYKRTPGRGRKMFCEYKSGQINFRVCEEELHIEEMPFKREIIGVRINL
ncbi:MAG: hypothetical protein AABX65_01395 [Nanoarchaeota archaeon]